MSANSLTLTSPPLSSEAPSALSASRWKTSACVLSADLLALTLIFSLTALGRHLITPTYNLASFLDLTPSLAMILFGFWLQGLYPGILMHPAEEMRRIVFSITIVFLIVASSAFFWRNIDLYSRSVSLIIWVTAGPLVLISRKAARSLCKAASWWGVSAIILGSGTAAERVCRTLNDGKWGIRVVGILSDNPTVDWPDDLPPNLGSIDAAPKIAASNCEYAILAMPNLSSQEIRDTIQSCCNGFRNVLLVPDMQGLFSLGIVARQMGTEIGFEVPQRLFHRGPAVLKRTLDFLLSLVSIIILSPVFLVLAACVRFSSVKGPIFYRQRRYGWNGSTFKALKFRTMTPDADQILANHLAAHPENRFEWQRDHKLKNDPRVTPVGKWMRRLSLDELPQLFNVLAGQMSLVGPRPIVKAEIEKYGDCYSLYSRVRPGITGLWQVSGRNNTTYGERVALDQYYVNNWSIWLDIYILALTLRTVVTADGAY